MAEDSLKAKITFKNAKLIGEISAKAIAELTFLGIIVAGKGVSLVAPGVNEAVCACLKSLQDHANAVTENDELAQAAHQQANSILYVV